MTRSETNKIYFWMAILFILIIGVLAASCRPEIHPDQFSTLEKKVDEYVAAYNDTYRDHGELINGTVLIAKNGEILIHKGYGFADLERGIYNGPETVYRIASITKPITALAVMQLVDEGELDIRAPLSNYLQEQRSAGEITPRHLLTHTAGIQRDPKISSNKYIPLEELARHNQTAPLLFSPGSKVEYSNSGYQLLAYLIEKVSGQSYQDYLEDRIFSPAGMIRSGAGISKEEPDNLARGHLFLSGSLVEVQPIDLSVVFGSGNLYATAEDLYHLDRAIEAEILISKATKQEIFQDQTGIEEDFAYGYGWEIADWKGQPLFHHGGYLTSGYSGEWLKLPAEDLVIIILNNTSAKNLYQVSRAFTAIALGEFYSLPDRVEPIALDPQLLNKYEGKYQLVGEDLFVTITSQGNKLLASSPGFTGDLLPYTNNSFYAEDHPETKITFTFDLDGNPRGFELINPLSKQECIRVPDN